MADAEKPVAAPAESANAPAQTDAPEPTEAKTGGDAPAVSDEKKETPAAVAGAADDADVSMVDASAADVSQVNGASSTPASSKKKSQRKKSTGGTPAKKLSRKKSVPDMHTDVKPGEHWYARMKGYPPWPAIICDEDMLPVSLLERRPVSAMRVNGTWREDFADGGKNVRDRRYPVMFLGTNEFFWLVNTDLQRLDLDEIKDIVARGDQGKKSKNLWEAYEIAAENYELQHFRDMLNEHDKLQQEEQAIQLAKEEEKQEKQAKREKKAKAKAADADGDVDMGDSDAPPKKKPSNKRKKASDEDTSKKTKIVLKGLKSSGDDAEPAPKKARKSKGQASEEDDVPLSPIEEEELRRRREKTILYLRHKLQKGLVSREVPPKPEEMDTMAEHLSVLESHQDLDANIIRDTKAHKLLKVILKLKEIPRDVEFKFKERCNKLLAVWSKTLAAADGEEPAAAETTTNGVGHAKEEAKEAKESKAEAETNGASDGPKDKPEEKGDEQAAPAAEDKPAPSIETAVEA